MGGVAATTNRANSLQGIGNRQPETKRQAVGAGLAGSAGGELPAANSEDVGKAKYFIRNFEVFSPLSDGRMGSLGRIDRLPPQVVEDMKSHPESIRLLKPADGGSMDSPVGIGQTLPGHTSHDDISVETREPGRANPKPRGSAAGDLLRSVGAEMLEMPHEAREAVGQFGTAVAGVTRLAVDGVKHTYYEMAREPTARERQEEANRRSIEYLKEIEQRDKETAEEQQAIDKFVDGTIRSAELIVLDKVERSAVDEEVKKELPTYYYLTRHPVGALLDAGQMTLGVGREIVRLPKALAKKAELAVTESIAKGADDLTRKHGYDHHDQFGRVVDRVQYAKTHRLIDNDIGDKIAYARDITNSPVFQFVDKHQDDITLIIKEGTKATITALLLTGGVPSPTARGIAAAIAAAVTTAAVDLAKDKDFAEIFKDAAYDAIVGGAAGYVGGRLQDRSIAALAASPNMTFLKDKVAEETLATLKAKSPEVFSKMSADAVNKLVDDQARRAVAATLMGRIAKASAGESGQLAVKAIGNLYKYTTVTTGPDGRVTVKVDTKKLAAKNR